MISSGSTGGTQAKYWVGNKFYKQDRANQTESLSEIIVSRFLGSLRLSNWLEYTKYHYADVSGSTGCYSISFLNRGDKLVSLQTFFRERFNIGNIATRYSGMSMAQVYFAVMSDLHRLFGDNAAQYGTYRALLDAITRNTDRHWRNVGVIVANDGRARLSPLYDFGNSLAGFVESEELSAQYCFDFLENDSAWLSPSFDTLVALAMHYCPVSLEYNGSGFVKLSDLRAHYSETRINRSRDILLMGIKKYCPYLTLPRFN